MCVSRDLLRRKARNRVLMLVKLLVRDEGERALDVVLQVTLVDLSKQSSFTPLLMSVFCLLFLLFTGIHVMGTFCL